MVKVVIHIHMRPQSLIDQIEAKIKVLEAEKAEAVNNEDYVCADRKKREVAQRDGKYCASARK